MNKLVILILGFLLITTWSSAQVSDDVSGSSFGDRIYVGGNLGMQFGDITSVEVSPLVGYRFTNDFSAGIGATYQYYKIKYNNGYEFSTNIYGGRVFARQNILEQFFAYGEFESLRLEYFDINSDEASTEWVPGLLIGGGLFQPISNRAGVSIMALYNVLYDDLKSPYNSPLVIRIGISAGF